MSSYAEMTHRHGQQTCHIGGLGLCMHGSQFQVLTCRMLRGSRTLRLSTSKRMDMTCNTLRQVSCNGGPGCVYMPA